MRPRSASTASARERGVGDAASGKQGAADGADCAARTWLAFNTASYDGGSSRLMPAVGLPPRRALRTVARRALTLSGRKAEQEIYKRASVPSPPSRTRAGEHMCSARAAMPIVSLHAAAGHAPNSRPRGPQGRRGRALLFMSRSSHHRVVLLAGHLRTHASPGLELSERPLQQQRFVGLPVAAAPSGSCHKN